MTNAIVAENLNRTSTETWEELGLNPGGDPRDVWDADSSNQIEGFATDISVNHGTTVEFKINVNANPGEDVPYHIEIYRLGYYGGDGARLVYSSGTLIGNAQPDAIMDQDTGMVSATNWNVSTDWDVPADAVSGVYLVKLVREDNNATNQIPFIVRDDEGPKSDIILQTSDTTWHAYNGWGGNNGEVAGNFYGDPSGQIDHEDVADPGLGAQDRAYAVSYDRPFITRDGGGAAAGPQDYLFGADYAAIYFLEKNGYDVSYISGIDTDRLGADYLIGHKAYISVGHDEYWSGQQRFNVEEARDNGVNLLFWSGNEVYWKTRLEASSDGTEYRTLVCYKETWANRDPSAGPDDYANIDPTNDWTGTWRDMRFVDAIIRDANGDPVLDGDGNFIYIAGGSRLDPHSLSHPLSGSDPNCNCITGAGPENSMTGQLFGPDGTGQPGATMDVAGALAGLRVWRDTTVATTGELHVPGILGYEWNTSPDDEHRPDGMIHLSESVDVPWDSILIDQGNHVQPGVATHNLSLYRADSGALVFGAGTVFWTWGLSDEHDNSHVGAAETLALKQFTLNMFADMGIQPGVADAILASQGLVRATQSTDHTAPTTTISIIGNPTEATEGQILTIHGTASDTGGVVAAIEVSTDGGQTWHPAEGTANWTYSWRASGIGDHTIKARAVDDSVNLQNSNIQSVELSVMASPESRLFTDEDAPTLTNFNDAPVELGLKFQASTNGYITQVLFYKDTLETGTHEGHLWTSDGVLLTTVDFINETASGWQVATLETPLAIAGGTTYVVSYHANTHYGATSLYFQADHVSGSLTAPASGTVGGNGVYDYGVGTLFPTSSFNASNYWVDVSFVAFTGPNNAPVIISGDGETDAVTISENSTFVTLVEATDPDAGQTPVFSIVGGADAALFQINPNTGELTFVDAPDFEAPGDNVYEVIVRAADSFEPGTLFDDQTISVTVEDVFEPVEIGFAGKTIHAEWLFDTVNDGEPIATLGTPQDVVVVIGGAPELPEFPGASVDTGSRGLADIDIEATQIQFTFNVDGANPILFSERAFNGLRLTDIEDGLRAITGVSVSQMTGFGDNTLEVGDIQFTADSIYVYLGGETRVDGATLILNVTFANAVPIIISNSGGVTATIVVDENTTAVTTVTATDADAVDVKFFILVGGEDSTLFHIDSNTGVLTLNSALDFENLPDDGPTDGYQVLVQVADGYGGTDTQLITVNIDNVNEDNDADFGDDAAVSISEAAINATEVGTVEYTISGVDADATAEVTFTSSGGGSPIIVSGLGNGTTTVNLTSLPDGIISASIAVTDTSNNTASGTGDSATLDTIADSAPVASVAFNDGDGFVSASEAGTASYTVVNVDGDATATVTFSDGNPLHNVTVSGLGNGTFGTNLSGLTDGPINVAISVSDTAGNSTTGTGDTSTKDTIADAAPVASVAFNDADGFVSASEASSVSYTVAGIDSNATATVTFSDGVNPDVAVSGLGNGATSVDLSSLSDGPITASISVTDTAGNSIGGTGDNSIKDTTADVTPVASVVFNDGDSLVSAAEAASVSFTVAGVDADAVATVTFSDGVNPDVVMSGLGNGAALVDLSSLSDGPITASISMTDAAGNSTTGTGDTTTKDTDAPNAPTIVLAEDSVGSETGNLSSGSTTDDNIPVLRVRLVGTNASASDSVRIFSGANPLVTALISANDLNNGYVSVTLPSLIDNTYNFTAKVVDVAGNASNPSATFTLSVEADTGEPPTDILLSNSSVTENAANALVGILSAVDPDANENFTFTLSDSANDRFVIVGNELRTTGALDFEDQGLWSIKVQVTDASNNTIEETMQVQVGDIDGVNIKGSQGNDVISAAKTVNGQPKATGEEDTILGRGGNDNINGAGGDDLIKGGAGDDKITGGLGVDQLFGNAGADRFIFKAAADSVAADADTITGFSHSQGDKIDLRGLEASAPGLQLSFIGGAGFGSQAGQVRYDAGLDLVQVDTDGNGIADFAIHVTANLVRSDFIL